MRPTRAAPLLAGRGDPSPRGCPPYAPRAGVSQPAPRGGAAGAVGRELHLYVAGCNGPVAASLLLVDCVRVFANVFAVVCWLQQRSCYQCSFTPRRRSLG